MSTGAFNGEAGMALLRRLLDVTASGRLEWKPLPDQTHRFLAVTSRFAYALMSRDSDDLAPYSLDIFRRSDEVVDLVDQVATVLEPSDDMAIMQNDLLKELYLLASRRARGVDNLLADLLSDLDLLEEE